MALVEEDFIQRMIRDIAKFLARITGLVAKGDPDAALLQVKDACKTLLGTPYELLDAVTPSSAADLLRDARATRAYGRLTAEEAQIHLARGDKAKASERRIRALELLIEAELRSAPPDGDASRVIAGLRGLVEAKKLGPKYLEWLDHNKA